MATQSEKVDNEDKWKIFLENFVNGNIYNLESSCSKNVFRLVGYALSNLDCMQSSNAGSYNVECCC